MRLDTSIRILIIGAIAMSPAMAGAQTGATFSPLTRPWFEASVGAAVGNHVRATGRPVCSDLGELCVPIASPLSVGGLLSLGGRVSDRLTLVAEMDSYTQKWNTLDGRAHREYVRFLMAGPRFYLPLGSGSVRTRIVGEALFGAAQREIVGVSDPVTQHRTFEVGGGLDWRYSKNLSSPSIRGIVSYAHAGDETSGLSEWRTSIELSLRFGTLAPNPPRASRSRLVAVAAPVGTSGHIEIAPAITMQTPPDVNLPPRCGALGLPCGSPRTFPDLGVTLSAAVHASGPLSVVGELSAYANNWRSSSAAEGQEINHVRAVLGGVRFRTPPLWIGGPQPSALRIFAQVLAGSESSSVTTRHSALQPGMGVDFYTTVVTVRCQLDYRFVPPGDRDLSAARFLIGLVFAR